MPNILVVDDDVAIREAVRDVLESEGYEVTTAANGREALGALAKGSASPPGIILLDVMMPVMDGAQFLDAYTADAALPRVPVVVLTAHEAKHASLFGSRVVQYLKKPLALADLLAVLERWYPAAAPPPAQSVRSDALTLPKTPPPKDWGGARSYYLNALDRFIQVVGAAVGIHIEDLHREVGVLGVRRDVQRRRNRTADLGPLLERL